MQKVAALDKKLEVAYKAILAAAPNAQIYVLGYPQLLSTKRQCSSTSGWQLPLSIAMTKDVYGHRSPLLWGNVLNVANGGGFSNAEINKIGNAAVFTPGEQKLLRDFAAGLDSRIKTVVNRLNPSYASRLHFVDPTAAGSPFIGHELCTATPAFNGVDGIHAPFSFHPNELGALYYAGLLAPQLAPKK